MLVMNVQGAKAPKGDAAPANAGSGGNVLEPMPTDPNNRPWTPAVVPGRFTLPNWRREDLADNLAAAVAEVAHIAAAMADEARERAESNMALQAKLASTRVNGLLAEVRAKMDQLHQLAEQADILVSVAHERALASMDEAAAQMEEAAKRLDMLANQTLEDARKSFNELNAYAKQLDDETDEPAEEAVKNIVGDIRAYAAKVAMRAAQLRIEADEIARIAEAQARISA
jgi:hypothetical protein